MSKKVLNQKQIQELVEMAKAYEGQTVIVSSSDQNFYRSQTMEGVAVFETEKGLCFMDAEENKIEFTFSKIENPYIDVMDIFEEEEPEVHIIFNFLGQRYSIVNFA